MDLVLENIVKRFGDKLAVEIPSLTIRSGEFFTFVGPSGCGKSTTLNLIAGLETPSSGAIQLGGTMLNPLPPQKRNVAFVFQSYALYPHRTVRGNLSFPLELAGRARKEIQSRVEEVAGLLGIAPLLDRRPSQLSGGERQRVALGRAIVRQPKLFLFDEPLSNLDAPLRVQMRKELRRLHAQLDTTFVYVTHDQEEALSLSERIAVMRDGRIQQLGAPGELYDNPANTFVASFFGTPPMNFFEGEIASEEGGLFVRCRELHLRLKDASGTVPEKKKVHCGIRPEDVCLESKPAADALQAKVVSIEMHGGQCHVELELQGIRLTALTPARVACGKDDVVNVTLRSAQWRFFDPQSGKRIEI
ncbi:MAG TPA: ABC transporter ATP-binding protein [Candidatus Acidoferrales bacterium]|jgi:multiple sugar transport system ATP-binding protein|nr:ABC transporter ATP-binding protein [Candidatus Acidoferrales bacterium]